MSWRGKLTPQSVVFRAPLDASRGGVSVSNHSVSDPENGASEPPLDSTAKSTGHFSAGDPRKQGRSDRFRWQRHAASLLQGEGRVGLCRWSLVSRARGVDVVTSTYEEGGARHSHFEGLQTCGSVWSCPCCSARISETRRGELNKLLSWSRSQGYIVYMVTLTARHGAQDDLSELLRGMKAAKASWADHRTYRKLRKSMVGNVTATEVTGGGANGWHPHFHVLFVCKTPLDLDRLREPWFAALRAEGLEGSGAGWRVQDASAAGRYVSKWGAAEELSLSVRKKGRGGRTPAQLLADSSDEGDRRAGALWREFSDVFKGRRQLVWSRGLKDLAGVGEIEDQEAARDQAQEGQQEEERFNLTSDEWSPRNAPRSGARERRAAVLEAAEEGGEPKVRAILSDRVYPDPFEDLDQILEGVQHLQRPPPRPGGLVQRLVGLTRGKT
jgi:hypothetical protein